MEESWLVRIAEEVWAGHISLLLVFCQPFPTLHTYACTHTWVYTRLHGHGHSPDRPILALSRSGMGPPTHSRLQEVSLLTSACLPGWERLIESIIPHPSSFCVTRLGLPKGGVTSGGLWGHLNFFGFLFFKQNGDSKHQSQAPRLPGVVVGGDRKFCHL
jgi:hypothetical protein